MVLRPPTVSLPSDASDGAFKGYPVQSGMWRRYDSTAEEHVRSEGSPVHSDDDVSITELKPFDTAMLALVILLPSS